MIIAIQKIEKVVHQDPVGRGIAQLFKSGDIAEALQALLPTKHVAIITGAFILKAEAPETDGPLGAFALARTLTALGKKVSIISDKQCMPSVLACKEVFNDKNLSFLTFPDEKQEQLSFADNFLAREGESPVDCLLSIERIGPAKDGSYRNMRGIDISQVTAPIDKLFSYVQKHQNINIVTIGIGDGGNEIGMGNRLHDVEKYIPLGDCIGCVTPVDHLITTGISNWGGYALAGALSCWALEHTSLKIETLFTSNEEQLAMLKNMVSSGCVDGKSLQKTLAIDGVAWNQHALLLDEIKKIILKTYD